jgi:hypothetical protein
MAEEEGLHCRGGRREGGGAPLVRRVSGRAQGRGALVEELGGGTTTTKNLLRGIFNLFSEAGRPVNRLG